jgi:hypothetical protein
VVIIMPIAADDLKWRGAIRPPGGFDAGEARRAILGLICCNLHLTGKREHVG